MNNELVLRRVSSGRRDFGKDRLRSDVRRNNKQPPAGLLPSGIITSKGSCCEKEEEPPNRVFIFGGTRTAKEEENTLGRSFVRSFASRSGGGLADWHHTDGPFKLVLP